MTQNRRCLKWAAYLRLVGSGMGALGLASCNMEDAPSASSPGTKLDRSSQELRRSERGWSGAGAARGSGRVRRDRSDGRGNHGRGERGEQLWTLARHVGKHPHARRPHAAWPPHDRDEAKHGEQGGPDGGSVSRDGGAGNADLPGDAGATPNRSLADAGSEEQLHPADAGLENPPPAPSRPAPPPLPRDIVAQSALPIYALDAGGRLTEADLWNKIAASPATCFGETHTNAAHHYAQLRAIEELAARVGAAGGGPVALGMEMFQRPFQAALSAFAAGVSSEEQLLADTQYATRWTADFSLYRPLVEAARERRLPLLALNARTELTRKIARTGLASLSAEEAAELPELDLDDPVHQEFIYGLFGVLPEHGPEFGLGDLYTAQTTWDETMAANSAEWLSGAGDDARLLVLAGTVHCHESAIPSRIQRRTGLSVLSVEIVFESELQGSDYFYNGYDVWVILEDVPRVPL